MIGEEITPIDVFFGLGNWSLIISCQDFHFHVHREVISQTSEVWNKMLNSGFAEAYVGIISFPDDDPHALKLSLNIIYSFLVKLTSRLLRSVTKIMFYFKCS